jgi:hypothetical protein
MHTHVHMHKGVRVGERERGEGEHNSAFVCTFEELDAAAFNEEDEDEEDEEEPAGEDNEGVACLEVERSVRRGAV